MTPCILLYDVRALLAGQRKTNTIAVVGQAKAWDITNRFISNLFQKARNVGKIIAADTVIN